MENSYVVEELIDFMESNGITSFNPKIKFTKDNHVPYVTFLYPDSSQESGTGALNLYFTKATSEKNLLEGVTNFNDIAEKLIIVSYVTEDGEPRTKLAFQGNGTYEDAAPLMARLRALKAVEV